MEKQKALRKDMFLLNKVHHSEKGITLIELLAAIVITVIVLTLTFSIIMKAIESNRNVKLETTLRDEADIIMSKFIATLYSSKQQDIIGNPIALPGNSYINYSTDSAKCTNDQITSATCTSTFLPIGFQTTDDGTTVHLVNPETKIAESYAITNNSVQILSDSTITLVNAPNTDPVYEVTLKLQITKKYGFNEVTKQETYINKIQPIH